MTVDMVNKPPHYTKGGIECIEAIKASMESEAYKGFLKGQVLKYLWRYEKKFDSKEDLEKANWYLNMLILEVGEETANRDGYSKTDNKSSAISTLQTRRVEQGRAR